MSRRLTRHCSVEINLNRNHDDYYEPNKALDGYDKDGTTI